MINDIFSGVIFVSAACIFVPLMIRLGLSPILGYLVAGIFIGPYMLNLVKGSEWLFHIAEMGVIFLMFVIGLELKPSRLWAMRKAIFGFGQLQIILTICLIVGIGYLYSIDYRILFVTAMGFSLSSTAIGAQMLASKGLLPTQGGRLGFAILLFQDIVVILMLALLPMLGRSEANFSPPTLFDTFKGIMVIIGLIFGGRYLTRPLMRYVSKANIRELSVAGALGIVLLSSYVMLYVGLSAALGAFLAGVLLADSEYRHAIQTDIEPFQGILMGLFFILIGMRVNFTVLQQMPYIVIGLTILLITTKLAVVYGLGKLFGLSSLVALQIGLLLAQGGEFGFVLFAEAVYKRAIDQPIADILTLIVTLSMVATPILWIIFEKIFVPKLSNLLNKAPPLDNEGIINHNHPVLLAGFGRFGQTTARFLAANKIGFTFLDSNAQLVGKLRKYGINGFFGDSNRIEVLEAAGLAHCKILIVCKDSPEAITNITKMVHHKYPHIKIMTRAFDLHHIFELEEYGAIFIEQDTHAASINMGVAVLKALGMDAYPAFRAGQKFNEHDKNAIAHLRQFADDESSFISETKRTQEALTQLFEDDREWLEEVIKEEW